MYKLMKLEVRKNIEGSTTSYSRSEIYKILEQDIVESYKYR